MDYLSLFIPIRFVIGLAFFLYASLNFHDTKCVENKCWAWMIYCGVWAFIIKTFILTDPSKQPELIIQSIFTTISMSIFAISFFYLDEFGGAIAKGLIATSVFIPEWDIVFRTPLPSTFLIITLFSFFALVKKLFYVALNIYHKDIQFPMMFSKTKMEIEKLAEDDNSFPAEEIINGKLVQISTFKISLDDFYNNELKKQKLDALHEAKINRVWAIKSFNAIAFLLSAYVAYHSIVYGISILGIPW